MSEMGDPSTRLTLEQQEQYRSRGYHFPIRIFDEQDAAKLRGAFPDSRLRNTGQVWFPSALR